MRRLVRHKCCSHAVGKKPLRSWAPPVHGCARRITTAAGFLLIACAMLAMRKASKWVRASQAGRHDKYDLRRGEAARYEGLPVNPYPAGRPGHMGPPVSI